MAQELTVKQKRFCDEYIICGNAKEAALKAGYSAKTAKVVGYENLTKPYLKAYIDERMEQLESNKIAKAEEVLQYLTSVMRGEVTEEIPIMVDKGLQELVDKDISIKDRNKAAELLGKRYRLFTDKVEVEGAVPVVISGEDDLED